MSEFLRVERAGAVATIWIDRQPKMNTMTVAMRNEFPLIFGGLDADATVRVVVVRGAGGGALPEARDRGHRRVYDGGRSRAGGRVRFSDRHAPV